MSQKNLLYQKSKQNVVTITLNRPDVHNAFNDKLISELTELFESIKNDPSVRLVVITGSGKSFCAGADLNWMKSMISYTEEENYQDSIRLAAMFDAINDCTRPVLGKINGSALGGGAGLLAVCDYVIASDSAKFAFTEVRLGLIPAVISPFVIAKIGQSNARATFLSGEIFGASRAREIGLIHNEAKPEELNNKMEELIGEYLKAAPMAAIAAKNLISTVSSKTKGETKEMIRNFTCKAISLARTSPEGQEGMNSLLKKTQPRWLTNEN